MVLPVAASACFQLPPLPDAIDVPDGAIDGDSSGADAPSDAPKVVVPPCPNGKTASGTCNQVRKLVAGGSHACALLTDGALWCWGSRSSGELGDGAHSTPSAPRRVDFSIPVRDVAAGTQFTVVALENDEVYGFGNNSFGAVGVYDATVHVPRKALMVGADRVWAGWNAACATAADDGELRCWGRPYHDPGTFSRAAADPVPRKMGIVAPLGVHLGESTACAATTSEVYCWGESDSGALGLGGTSLALTPTPLGLAGVVALTGYGREHVCAATEDRSLFCWGESDNGALGTGAPWDLTTPSQVPPTTLGEGVDEIAAGWNSTCGLAPAGIVLCWGDNAGGILGQEVWPAATIPTPHPTLVGGANLTVGRNFACVVGQESAIWCWGDNGLGALGTGATGPIEVHPRLVLLQ